MKKTELTIQELREAAKGQGSMVSMEGGLSVEAYTGDGDDLVDMESGGNVVLMDEHGSRRVFVLTLTNTDNQTRKALINPGIVFDPNAPDIIKDGAFHAHGASLADPQHFLGAGNPTNILKWLHFIQKNPTRIAGIRLKTSDPTQFSQVITLKRDTPWSANTNSREIYLANFESEGQFNNKLLTVPEGFTLDNETEMTISVPGGATTTIHFYAAASLSITKAFGKKVDKALKTFGTEGRTKIKTAKFVQQSPHQLGS